MKKITPFYTALALTGMIALSGCTFKPTTGHQLVAQPDAVSLRLASSVDRASAALETLAAVEQARTPLANVSPVTDAPRELMRSISVDWAGPLEQITARLAERVGYNFNVAGIRPPVPVVVTLNVVEKPVIDVLRDLGLQGGTRADVVVDADNRTVEVSYVSLFDESM